MTHATETALRNANLFVGSIVEVLPAYEMDTGARTHFDEIAGCQAQVIKLYSDGDAEIMIKGTCDEFSVTQTRLKVIR